MKYYFFTLLACVLLAGCTSYDPKPINYGSDQCSYCQMTIVDPSHASQLITQKGKVFKYDSIECMLHSLAEQTQPIAQYFVNDYQNPAQFLPTSECTFIISEQIPSPMGGNISALKNQKAAIELALEKAGELYSWEELILLYQKENNE